MSKVGITSTDSKGEFMTTAEISDKLVTYGGIKKPMFASRLGTVLGGCWIQGGTPQDQQHSDTRMDCLSARYRGNSQIKKTIKRLIVYSVPAIFHIYLSAYG